MTITERPPVNPAPVPDRSPAGPNHKSRSRRRSPIAAIAGALAATTAVVAVGLTQGDRQVSGHGVVAPRHSDRVPTSAPKQPGSPVETSPAPAPNKHVNPAAAPDTYNPAVRAVVERYQLHSQQVPYTQYYEGTQKYAAAEKFPDQFYDLTKLQLPTDQTERSQTLTDLAPIFVNNALLFYNTHNVHYLDVGPQTVFGYDVGPQAPKVLLAPQTGYDYGGYPDNFNSFAVKPVVDMEPYDGTNSAYLNTSVTTLKIPGVAVSYILNEGNSPGQTLDETKPYNPPGGDGPRVDMDFQFDDAGTMIGVSIQPTK